MNHSSSPAAITASRAAAASARASPVRARASTAITSSAIGATFATSSSDASPRCDFSENTTAQPITPSAAGRHGRQLARTGTRGTPSRT